MLAQAENIFSIVVWSAVFIALLVAGFAVVVAVRRYFRGSDEPTGGPGFTLGELRRMHRDGTINDQQYEKLRQHIIGSVAGATGSTGAKASGGDRPSAPPTAADSAEADPPDHLKPPPLPKPPRRESDRPDDDRGDGDGSQNEQRGG